MNRMSRILSIVTCSLLSFHAFANYSEQDNVKVFAKNYAEKFEKNETDVLALLAQGKKQQAIIDAISKPAERVLTWGDYRRIFIEEQRLIKGVEFEEAHRDILNTVAKEYGVPSEMILAIMGVETRYGRIKGNYRVLDALMTLSFDYPPRAKFFSGQLEQFLLMTEEQNLNATELKGSYAGAMGYGQFIPGSYRAYAVDFDKDGTADIWNNEQDAIASIANYFKQHKWQTSEPIAYQLKTQNIDKKWVSKSRKPDTTVGQLREAGVDIPMQFSDDAKVILMALDTPNGVEHWLGFHNFYVITRYNHSNLYALAAFQLSELLRYNIGMKR